MFKPHPEADALKRSAIALVKYLLANENPEILHDHLRELLSVLLWKITEAESYHKHESRFQSQEALNCDKSKTKLRHDHVYPRSKMLSELENTGPDKIDSILERAVGCTVTKEEHSRLSKLDNEYDGWARYEKAGILVIDTKTMSERGS
jgi:hypothetical protein